ncbi:MAG: hypothetical protein N2053_02200 [Chitinispirillaceae bacterium]|nr:hypothetical protein [Chitinispirillaceae bacterium]
MSFTKVSFLIKEDGTIPKELTDDGKFFPHKEIIPVSPREAPIPIDGINPTGVLVESARIEFDDISDRVSQNEMTEISIKI